VAAALQTARTQRDEGVFFRQEDYAGFWRRLAADAVDVALIILLLTAATSLFSEAEMPARVYTFVLLTICYVYLVLLKRSRVRTLGYILTRIRIVDLQGNPPSVLSLSLRLFLALLTSLLGFPYGMVWIYNNRRRQATWDALARTYVVKARAQPVGRGRMTHDLQTFWCLSFLVPEVRATS
jgi:uncharacterized RDD family membrane protein YckC